MPKFIKSPNTPQRRFSMKVRGVSSQKKVTKKLDSDEDQFNLNERNSLIGSRATDLYFTFKILSILIPALPIYLGYRLFIAGITGEASIVINATDINGQLVNAAPGLFFAVGGIVALVIATLKGINYEA